MNVIYIGASKRVGTSAKTGSAYSICEVLYGIPDENASKKNPDGSTLWDYTATGFTTRTIPLDDATLETFKELTPFKKIKLVLEPDPRNPTRNLCAGFEV